LPNATNLQLEFGGVDKYLQVFCFIGKMKNPLISINYNAVVEANADGILQNRKNLLTH
jgi:hypothetical protein